MTFGLVAFGAALGAPAPVTEVVGEYSRSTAKILAYGYRNVLRSPADVGVSDLAVKAAKRALVASGVSAGDLDLVVLALTDVAEYLYWDAAASVAHRLGATEAEAVLLTQACTTGVLSFDAVAGKLATHPDYQTALIIAASRCCEAYWNRMDTQPLVFSDGAAAAVLRRDHPSLRWLVTEARTEGRFADFYRLDSGGAAAPFGMNGGGPEPPQVRGAWEVMEFFGNDPRRFEDFTRHMDEATKLTLERACARTGTAVGDLAKVILLCDNLASMESLAGRLGVPLARTNLDLALEHGHLGAADQLFCLGQYHSRGELDQGSRVALISRGRGMHWACTLLEV